MFNFPDYDHAKMRLNCQVRNVCLQNIPLAERDLRCLCLWGG